MEATSGLNLWAEWAKLEVLQGSRPYELPAYRKDHGGLVLALARQESPDTSSFDDPEVVKRIDKKHHIGLVVRAATPERVEELLESYERRIASDFLATLPEAAPTH
ncbi:MAG: hypothetical protein U0166_13915 [Acidobacteriota bacterium]